MSPGNRAANHTGGASVIRSEYSKTWHKHGLPFLPLRVTLAAVTRRLLPLFLGAALLLPSCCPPPVSYPACPLVTQRRATLADHLLELLPENERQQPAAQEEARWLADTAYKASAGIARINDSHFPGWLGNALINARMQDRGLCWHYQHDLYRELRRRKLNYFRLGCCVRDQARATEHNCLYIAAREGAWPEAWVLDAWMWNGRLKVDRATELDADDWEDLPGICWRLCQVYTEEHTYPVEHWYMLRCPDGRYGEFWDPYTRRSAQYRRMYEKMEEGQRTHPGSLMNY